MNDKLVIREHIKARKPHFVRQDAHRFKGKLGEVWRKPRGHHSKMRLSKKGKPAKVNKGYRSPRLTRGMTRDGRIPIRVHNKLDLEKLDLKVHVAIIGASVGRKKKSEIITAAQQRGIKIFNIKDVGGYKDRLEKEMEERRKARAQIARKNEKKAEEKKDIEAKQKKEEKTLEERSAEKIKEEEKIQKEKEVKRREAEKVMIQK